MKPKGLNHRAFTSKAYPFSNKVTTLHSVPTLVPNDNALVTKTRLLNPFKDTELTSLRRGVGLIPHLERTLPSPASHDLLSRFFARRGRGRINPGSVLTLSLSQPPYTYSGVLMSIRRKGPDSSILLRNVVRKTGVEMRIPLASPTLTGIKLVQRAGGKSMTNGPPASKSTATKKKPTKAVVDKPNPAEWKLGTPGPLPTRRYARNVGILPKVTGGSITTPVVPVDEKSTVFAKRARRARLYFLRDYPGKMSAISAGISKRDN